MPGATRLLTAGGGAVQIQPASSIAADVTVQVPAQNCTLGIQGPAFSAYLATNQSISSGSLTKVQLATEVYDTANCFDTTTYRFTPNVAGYYVFTAATYYTASGTSTATSIYKNGSSVSQVYGTTYGPSASVEVYMNGTTDYIELYAYIVGTASIQARADLTYMQGALVRAA